MTPATIKLQDLLSPRQLEQLKLARETLTQVCPNLGQPLPIALPQEVISDGGDTSTLAARVKGW